jgi:YVTN family beta-propeller protein
MCLTDLAMIWAGILVTDLVRCRTAAAAAIGLVVRGALQKTGADAKSRGSLIAQLTICLAATAAIALPGSALARQFLWQTNGSGNDVHVIDVETRKVVRRIVVGPEPHGIAAPEDARVVYISIEANGQDQGALIWVDPRSYRITGRMAVCREPHAIATTPDGRWVYVPCRDGHYAVVDAAQQRIVKRIRTGGRPHNVRISPDGRYAYLSPMGSPRRVTIVDIAAGHRVSGTIAFSASVRPSALAADNGRFYQHIDGLNGFEVADIPSRRVIARVRHAKRLGWFLVSGQLGWLDLDGLHRCHGLAVRPGLREIWSVCGRSVNVHSLIGSGHPEIATVALVNDGYWLTFTPDGAQAFVALHRANKVAVVDAKSKVVAAYIEVGKGPARNLVVTLAD